MNKKKKNKAWSKRPGIRHIYIIFLTKIFNEIIYFLQTWKRTKHSWQAKLNTSWIEHYFHITWPWRRRRCYRSWASRITLADSRRYARKPCKTYTYTVYLTRYVTWTWPYSWHASALFAEARANFYATYIHLAYFFCSSPTYFFFASRFMQKARVARDEKKITIVEKKSLYVSENLFELYSMSSL